MNKLITLQSNVFIVISLLALALVRSVDMQEAYASFIVLIIAIVIFGVPHGALDVLFARQTYALENVKQWLLFITFYSLIALLIVAIWLMFPSYLFWGFLLLSAVHFAADIPASAHTHKRLSQYQLLALSYGMSLIIFPSYFYADELIRLYGMIVGYDAAALTVQWFQPLCIPLMLIVAVSTIWCRPARRTGIEMLCALGMMLWLHPLIAFTLYFCFMHSARHIVRSKFFLTSLTGKDLFLALTVPTLAVIGIAWIIWHFSGTQDIQSDLIPIVFVGLAALTLPHAWLLKKSAFYQNLLDSLIS